MPVNKSISKRIKDIKLNALLEITKAINNNFSTEQLLQLFEDVLSNHLNIGRLVLFSHDNDWKCILKYGVAEEYNSINVERDLLPIKEIGTINFSKKNLNKSFEIVIPVYHKSQPLAFVLIGDLEDRVEVSPAIKHLPFVQTLTSIIVVAIENKKLAKENIRQAAMKKELELASEMQAMLFPTALPVNDKLEASAFYLPHQQVGGDYYDFIWLSEQECAFCVADVSGKGVAAALLMSNFQATLRVLIQHTNSLTSLIKELNNKVMDNAKGEKFITFFIAKYNIQTRQLSYVNAAHNPPLLVSNEKVELLSSGCTGLGMFDEIEKIEEGRLQLAPDSTIICYTDGLVELENEKNEEFGTDALQKFVLKKNGLTPHSLNKAIVDEVIDFKQSKSYVDDIALFSIKFY